MLQAGYLEEWRWHETLSGAPQGGVCSPILSNIYLDKLDKFVETVLLPKYNRGKRRAKNPAYQHIENAIARAKRKGDRKEMKALRKQRRIEWATFSVEHYGPENCAISNSLSRDLQRFDHHCADSACVKRREVSTVKRGLVVAAQFFDLRTRWRYRAVYWNQNHRCHCACDWVGVKSHLSVLSVSCQERQACEPGASIKPGAQAPGR